MKKVGPVVDIAVIEELIKGMEDETQGLAFQRRLYLAFKKGIQDGRLTSGLRIPSSRVLATELRIARNSVLYAYEQLIAEGYFLASKKGTRVAQFQVKQHGRMREPETASPNLSRRGLAIPIHWRTHSDIVKPFTPGIPDISRFPLSHWKSLLLRTYSSINPRRLTFGEIGGEHELRAAVATHLRAARGVYCDADNVVITQGAQGALDLLARMLADPGQTVWVENPGYYGARVSFQAADLQLHPIAVDEHGANPSDEDWEKHPPRLVYLTPAHQYPTGAVLGITRRYEIIQKAMQHGSWIIEDDYDGELRYSSDPIPALHSLIPNAPTIYVGTFSKTLLPVLRIGFMVVPKDIAKRISSIGAQFSRPGHVVEQLALAQLIESGWYARHIKTMRHLYAEKQRVLRQALMTHLKEEVTISGGSAGLHLMAKFNQPIDDVALNLQSKSEGLIIAPLSTYYLPGTPAQSIQQGMLLGYGTIPACIIEDSVRRLRRILDEQFNRGNQACR